MATDIEAVVAELLERHGRTFAEEIGADVPADTAEGMFALTVFAVLAGAPIRTPSAVAACRALLDAGWTDAAAMAEATGTRRTEVLRGNGYAGYDESISHQLEAACRYLSDTYDGDIRGLRRAADGSPERERALLQRINGIGPVGADIFLREAQAGWDELIPYIDERVCRTARELGLPTSATRLADLVERTDLPRLVAALVRVRQEHDVTDLRESTSGMS
ncbi:hypothetical protein MXD59_17745 [Frankia sp. Ag45/Mut15]|uniref:Endonuclease III-like protein n=1 Tax=Frankia umida TaxID=573489 RepID=A0ABT0K1D6_9ACTN|nr:hypothetical protein [Frankia umida]MCK9877594.1 hypothetical protein [Frankia umida]